jgi:adenylylsulfate reductase subunit A
MVQYLKAEGDKVTGFKETDQELVDYVYKPVRNYLDHCTYTTAQDINPNYCKPAGMALRLMKMTNEYGGGIGTYYMTSGKNLEVLMGLFEMFREDLEKIGAGDLHELMRAWEITHRLYTVQAHTRHIQFREESRYPGFYYRGDFMGQNDDEWFCFTNSTYNKETNEWSLKKVPYVKIIAD